MKKNINQHIIVVFLRLLSVFLVYFFCRVLFYLFNQSLFTDVGFLELLRYCFWGLRFDLAAILYLNILFIVLSFLPFKFRTNSLYQKIVILVFYVFNSIGILVNTLDFAYFPFILHRTTSNIFDFIASESNIANLGFQLALSFWYVPLSSFLLIVFFIYINGKMSSKCDLKFKHNYLFLLSNSIILVLFIGLSIIGIRGGIGVKTKPISVITAAKYVDNTFSMPIVLNTPFSIIRTFFNKDIKPLNYFSEEKVNEIFSVQKENDATNFTKQNVVVIILESFGKEYSGYLNPHLENGNYQGYTPFFDSLMKESKVYVNAFSNGRKSDQGIPSIIAGIPSLNNVFITSQNATNSFEALPSLLAKEGYSSTFYHGAENGSMCFESFASLAGYDSYFGKTEYTAKFDFEGNVWGVFDEQFFQFFGNGLDDLEEPFFSTFFSLSSHSPFTIPEKHIGRFKKGPLPIHETVSYSDFALKQFFNQVKDKSWYNNTLFVITADHCSLPYYPEYKTSSGYFSIPIVYYQPNDTVSKGIDSTYTQQMDILPTVLSYLNYQTPYFSFGNDANDTTQNHFSINYLNGSYQFFMDGYLLLFDLKEEVAFYNLKKDKLLENNLKGTLPKKEAKMLNLCKAFIQQYNNRLLDNRFLLDSNIDGVILK